MKINKKEFSENTFLGHLLIAVSTATYKGDGKISEFLKRTEWFDAKQESVDVSLTVAGEEQNLREVCKEWDKQIERMVHEEAVLLFDKEFDVLTELFSDFKKKMVLKAKEQFNLEIEEDERW